MLTFLMLRRASLRHARRLLVWPTVNFLSQDRANENSHLYIRLSDGCLFSSGRFCLR